MQNDDILKLLQGRQYDAAFAPLLEQFKDKVFRLAFSILHNETHAEDVAQDVFVKIWKGLPGYNGGASLSTWIYTITRNTALTELKRRDRRATVSLEAPEMEDAAGWIPALQSTDPGRGLEMDVAALLADLPENYRRVITLFYLEQKSYEEAARMLGIPLGTVKTLLFRAKKELLRMNSRHGGMVPAAMAARSNPSQRPVPSRPAMLSRLAAISQLYPIVTYAVPGN